MKNQISKIRIKDIAKLAGVSEGTVDRVLHNRGEVSEKSKIAVEKILEEINYSPNILARSLASKKHFRFVCLIPSHQPEDYWESVERGFDLAGRDFLQFNIYLEKLFYNQFDLNSFKSVSEKVIESKPDAVIMAPIFREQALEFSHELQTLRIPFSFIDSMIEEAEFTSYYGQNSFQSGYVAAKLLLNSLPNNAQVVIIRTKRKGGESNQTKARSNGFMQYVCEKHLINFELINVDITDDDENLNSEILREVCNSHNNIKAAITFNSKVYQLARNLEKLNKTDVRLIGYDLLDENIKYLKNDIVSFLLAQRPDKQAYHSVRDMCSVLIFKQKIKKINYVPIDILMKENIEDYIEFREKIQ